jgi:hypothetical protein
MKDSRKQIIDINISKINWSKILSALLVIVTSFYVYFIFRMMKAYEKSVNAIRESIDIMRKQIEASLRLNIGFELRRYPNDLIYVHIKNTGKINAVNLTLSLDKDFLPMGNQGKDNLKESVLF